MEALPTEAILMQKYMWDKLNFQIQFVFLIL